LATGDRIQTARAGSALRERREANVREHMESENRHEFGVTLRTFDHPRYGIIAAGWSGGRRRIQAPPALERPPGSHAVSERQRPRRTG
jgi:hypothetical protein